MGDLNFRLVEEYERTPEEIDRAVKKGDLEELFQFDQLRYVMRRGEAFSELNENEPRFPPTFKFEVGTNKYDYKCVRWCCGDAESGLIEGVSGGDRRGRTGFCTGSVRIIMRT